MQTRFTERQLADSDVATSEQILRKCVHCGFCTATCPTYVLLGDELDSPRGRIYLIKEMLENDRPATEAVVRHVDRCLSCLACMTTCPSGVHYQHLIDHARAHVERTFRRPWPDRALRALLAAVLPYPGRLRAAFALAALARPFARLLPTRLRALLALATVRGRADARASPPPAASAGSSAGSPPIAGVARARVALLTGCVQNVVDPAINAATIRLLNRAGAEVVAIPGCCGAIVHHLGRSGQASSIATRLIDSLAPELHSIDAVVVNASGCGTHVKDYAHVFRNEDALAAQAQAISAKTRDVTELLTALGLPPVVSPPRLAVAYHSACSMQHGQKIDAQPRALLVQAGYEVKEIAEGHLCCGSAGSYNVLQPEIAARLRERKLASIARAGAAVVATGNIGCMVQLAGGTVPIVHTVELLDWATGGPKPVMRTSPGDGRAKPADV
jgi:glycolate oxidase iron-sulfur subunit